MKKNLFKKCVGLGLAALTLASAGSALAQTFITESYTNSFDLGANTADFSGSGSVASWIRWYDYGGSITNKYGLDANNQTATSGCMEIFSPFGAGGNQNVFFGTFANRWGYDFDKRINMVNYTNITFDVMMAPGTQPRTNSSGVALDFGNINVGIINAGYGFQGMGNVTIPLAASNSWVHLKRDVDITQANLSNVPGIAMQYANYGGYPHFATTFYLDNLQVHLSPVQVPPPTLSGDLRKPVAGLNAIDVSSTAQYDRDQVVTVASTGYTFAGQSSVTYTWDIAAFPANTGGSFQQHFMIVNGAPGPYDTAADYNLADCIFVTVQQADNGTATMNFRYKTNNPAGNGMLFNGTDPTNTVSNPNGWPIMPVGRVATASGAVGTWSVTFANSTNVTLNGPGGVSTNFVLDAASAALFADPASLLLGGQANNVNGAGQAVVYNSFSATGCATPINENFAAQSTLNTNIWKNYSSDANAIVLVPQGSAYWLSWSIPDGGFSLQAAATVNAASGSWTDLSPKTLQSVGKRQALLPASTLPSAGAGFYRLITRTFTKLQVLLPGQVNAPGTALGYTGTPTTISLAAQGFNPTTITVNAVDADFHIISGVGDMVHLATSDGSAFLPADAAMVNGTATFTGANGILFQSTGPQTVTATDVDDNTKTAGVSAAVTIAD